MSTSNLSNLSSSEKDLDCGALYEPYVFKISLIIVYCTVLLVGSTGNALIITLVYKKKDLRKTINQLIANMAFSDFVFQLTFIPVELAKAAYGQWPIAEPAGSIVCKIQSFVISTSVYVSVQSLSWIALDRFIAVVFPMKVHLISSRFRVLAIASSWIVALLCGSASSVHLKVVHKNGPLVCTEETTPNSQYAGATGSFASLISVTILCCTIAVTLQRKNKALPTSTVNGNIQRKRQAMKMSICIVAAFYLCFIPVIYCCLVFRKSTGKIMFFTQSTKAINWPDDQPIKLSKSNDLFHLCRKLPAWPERILWFVSY
ncbi:neuropeptide Y receptor type 2-like [Porites lutea]|uniref:neuropeptide Y receptor type 2-like n=1 Tax=Porites lutea TaxID=51062 RepID=UPI003CC5268F